MAYVYTFTSSLDGQVFYVGKGNGDGCTSRIRSHLYEAIGEREKVSPVAQAIRSIWQQGGKVIIGKPYNDVSDREANRLETLVIEQHGYGQLLNSPWAKHRKQWMEKHPLATADNITGHSAASL